MTPPRQRLFVERPTYRRRRILDAMRAMPVLGLLLWLVPLLWSASGNEVSATSALIYLFGGWIGLVVVSAGLIVALRIVERQADEDGDSS